jgi:predicted nucleic acid-binding protein
MVVWARIVSDCRRAGGHKAVKLTDTLIAATAVDRGLPVVTQDRYFDLIARAHPDLRVIEV